MFTSQQLFGICALLLNFLPFVYILNKTKEQVSFNKAKKKQNKLLQCVENMI